MPTPEQRQQLAESLAQAKGWQASRLKAGQFELLAYLPTAIKVEDEITVYIEGDGLAWVTPYLPSTDPTPRDPMALRLALAQPQGNAAYLARPCQYVDAQASQCALAYWTEQRFAPEVITATNAAIDQLKQRFAAKRLSLVGYSGGAAIAALVAARRPDVTRLITVAGNLDQEAWTTFHQIKPLAGSLSPVADIGRLQSIQQWHLVGALDSNTPPELTRAFLARFPQPVMPGLQVLPGFDHQCCWAESWAALWQSQTNRP
jgi:pimeloyl-ACP methyl ester carboxylesterase